MKAIILAAGYATRLYPLTLDKPKALLELSEGKVLDYITDKIPDSIKEVYIITNSRFFKQFAEWIGSYKNEKNLEIKLLDDGTSREDDRLGAIGDLALPLKYMEKDDALVIASDNLFDSSLQNAYNFFNKTGKNAVVIYDIKNKENAGNFGVVKIDSENRIVEFEEKPEKPGTSLISTGIYFFRKETLDLIGEYAKEGHSQDKLGFFIKWLSQNQDVYGFNLEGRWYDIGNIKDFEEAKKNF